MPRNSETDNDKLDDAARAGWLYYLAGDTQDEIARKLGISRQTAQRLVSLSVSAKLIKVRLDHPIGRCMDLAAALKQRFGIGFCEVTPADPDSRSHSLGVANVAAAELERYLSRKEPIVVAMGTGKEMRGTAAELRPMSCPQHKLVSLIGNIAPDGTATLLDAVSRAADAVNAPHYPMPCPLFAETRAERDALMEQRQIRQVIALAQSADVTFVGIGSMVEDAPLVQDGFISLAEMRAMMALGSAGEITGWAFDDEGNFINGSTNDRVIGAPPARNVQRSVIGVSIEPGRFRAIRAALRGRLINGLITNETMAVRLLG